MPHLAQLNIATLRHPLDHPATAEFVAGLATVNAAADTSPGFVWRLQTDEGDATSIAVSPDPLTIANFSVWESLEAFREFAFRGVHREFLRRRAEWFQPGSQAATWWVPAGTIPTLAEGLARVGFVERFGSTPYAFAPTSSQPCLVVRRTTAADPAVQAMIPLLDRELIDSTPDGGCNFLTADTATFFVAELEGTPRAMGAYRRIDEIAGAAEVKRMWADPEVRGARLGAAILATIEAAALADGFTELRLETGEHLAAAVGLYRRFGFEQCANWGEYAGVPFSYCMSKQLT
jgi:GNAT superfamily N-acetyltransferase